MEKILSIEKDIFEISNGQISVTKEINYKWIILVIVGLSMSYIQSVVDPENGAITMALFIFGIALVLIGVVKLLSKKDVYHLGAQRLTLKTMKYDASYSQAIKEIIEKGEFEKLSQIPDIANVHVLLKVLFSDNFSLVYVQCFKFEEYSVVPFSEAKMLNDAECQAIKKLIK